MTYQEVYDKLMKHNEHFGPWAEMQKKLGMAISRPSDKQMTKSHPKKQPTDTMTSIRALKQNEELSRFVEEIEETNNRF